MAYQIEVKVKWRSGHRLIEPYKGKCNQLHGEGYTGIFIFERDKLDDCGMVFDFGDIKKKIKNWIDERWDHAYICHEKDEIGDLLSKIDGQKVFIMKGNPTAENMCKLLHKVLKEDFKFPIKKVGVIESFEDSIAWYEE